MSYPPDKTTIEIHRDHVLGEEKLLGATKGQLEKFFHDYEYVHRHQKSQGEVVVFVRKKPKCINCVMWVKTKFERLGICGDPDRHRTARETCPGIIIESTVNADEVHFCFRRKRRTIGGHPVDERVSCLLEKRFV